MQIDRRLFIASLGGVAAVRLMSHEAKAEALEAYMIQQLNPAGSQAAPKSFRLLPISRLRLKLGSIAGVSATCS